METLSLLKLPELLLNAPLYQSIQLDDDLAVLSIIYGKEQEKFIFDGYCLYCDRETNYILSKSAHIPNGDPWKNIRTHEGFESVTISCVRNEEHIIKIHFLLSNMKIQKIGQFPSLADIENGKCKIYRKNMSKIDSNELYKAIGLAAHGVGIGSFVYLRRILERIVTAKFNEFKDLEQWDEEKFKKERMIEKVITVGKYLPQFLANNAKIYSILSLGIHELNEKECLAAFEILKKSIIYILEENIRKKEELAARKDLESAIASFK